MAMGFKKYDPKAFLARQQRSDAAAADNFSRFSTLAGGVLPGEASQPASQPEGTAPATAPAKVLNLLKLPHDGDPSPLADAFAILQRKCPGCVEPAIWRQAVADSQQFMDTWGKQAWALGWTAEELFGLHEPPSNPHPSYNRLARYDCKGLVWILEGRPVLALTADTATIRYKSGSTTKYKKLNKPGLGPVGDSLDDFV
jgi:hypothetical protein